MLRILFPLYLVMIIFNSYSQIAYGIKGGLNISDVVINNYINPDAESDFDLKLGLHAGLFASTSVTEKFSFLSEILYSNKGVKAITPVNLHYINVPLLGRYMITEDLLVEVGPELGYLFSARSKYGDVSNTWDNKLDLGLDAGIQYEFSGTIAVGLRYYAGFSSVIDIRERDANNSSGETIKYQNRVLQISVACKLGEKMF